MGYTLNEKSLERARVFLDAMIRNKGERLEWRVQNSARTVYMIHQAFHIANNFLKKGDRRYAHYAALKDAYYIKKYDGKIVAEPKDIPAEVKVYRTLATVTVPDAANTLEIIGAAIAHKADKMFFPDASVEHLELERLYNWAQAKEYFIIIGEAGLTLTKEDPEDLAWKPTHL